MPPPMAFGHFPRSYFWKDEVRGVDGIAAAVYQADDV